MKIAFLIHTPGQANFWRNPILTLQERGNNVMVIARDDGLIGQLLCNSGIKYKSYGVSGKTSKHKIAQLPQQFLKCFSFIRSFHPDIVLGTGIMEAHSAFLLRKPSIIFEDTEITPKLERIQWQVTASTIVTPSCFRRDFGRKHIRFEGYKEMAYLHPDYFKPDISIFDDLKIKRGTRYIVVRFNRLDAVHDIYQRGFKIPDRFKLVHELEKYAQVFISPEAPLPEGLEKYKIPISPNRIHHALYYAQLFVSDTGTTSVESGILGTPTVMYLTTDVTIGNFTEMEQKYGLINAFSQTEDVIKRAVELIQQPDAKENWRQKRQKLLAEKIDVTRFLVDFIEDYPESIQTAANTLYKYKQFNA